MQILGVVGTSEKLDAPIFSSPTSTSTGFTFTITNYNALNTYTATTTAGTVSVSTSTVTQAGLGYSTSATVTVTVSRAGFESSSGTRSGTSSAAPCVPAGCTPPCGTATFSSATPCAGSIICTGCPGCTTGDRRWALDCYTYSQQSCVDNCGITYYNTCSSFCVDSTVSSSCCPSL